MLVTQVKDGKVYEGCDNCINQTIKQSELSAKYHRSWQQKEYRRELTQPNQKEFLKAYPEKASEYGFSDDQIRRYS